MTRRIACTRTWVALSTAGLLFQAASCNVDELDVAYLALRDVSVVIAGTIELDGIVALRVVRDAESLGFYPVPADVPIVGTGEAIYALEPAVRRSGLAEQVIVYPLYEPVVQSRTLRLGSTDTIRPVFGYREEVTVGLDEGFEGETSVFELEQTPGGSAPLTQTFEDVRSGRASGVITLSAEAPIYEVASVLVEPDRDRLLDVWVEMDYRGEGILAVALFPAEPIPVAQGEPLSSRYFQGALPRTDWTKLYFDIVDDSNRAFIEAGFRVSLLAIYDPELGVSQRIFLDNLRIVYR